MNDPASFFIGLALSALCGWLLIQRLQTGAIEAGSPTISANRATQPVKFWFCVFYNAMFCAGGLLLMGDGMGILP